MYRLIALIDSKNGIARNGVQPITIPSDLRNYRRLTTNYGGNVLVGKNTFINDFHSHSLIGRKTYVLSRSLKVNSEIKIFRDINDASEYFKDKDVWISGGESIYKQFIEKDLADELYITRIYHDFNCDQFFPEIKSNFELKNKSNNFQEKGYTYNFEIYKRK